MAPKNDRSVNVLFTSVGRRVELLRSFRTAYQSLDLPGKIVATDISPLAPALQEADCPYIVPRIDSHDYLPTLTRILRKENVSLVFPLIDPDIPVLASGRAQLEASGASVAVIPKEAVALAADKWATTGFFKGLGLETPRSWLPGDLPPPEERRYPLFVKPRFGSAAQNTFKVDGPEELDFFLRYVDRPIVQEYIDGAEITSDVLCSADGEIFAVVSRRRIEVRWGEVAKGVTVHHSAIQDACRRIARNLPARGPVTVQCLMEGDTPLFTEINARLGGGVPLSFAAGANWPLWLLARAAQLPVKTPPPGSYRAGLYLTRFDQSRFVSEEECDRMSNHHL